ncbi:hypothetical protein GBK02_06140 [Dechloromonas sp. TW-R-39-2]|uniref:TniQ family protein n=1 Tax=Dechloromonas sp. TW-R-39-2 TaxID=2654218 RepID=UPI00193CA8F4|nr:TniQ family protein [Dechloromonas sp. TW-R-39-2]QRM19000.1 hypothetical protein GBK02_06140 [Dechloromonas sp. TW-R-39-2]
MFESVLKIKPIPDETSYGLVMALGNLLGARSYGEALTAVFGDARGGLIDPLDCEPNRLAALLGKVSLEEPGELLLKHSLWPYFIAFHKVGIAGLIEIAASTVQARGVLGLNGSQLVAQAWRAKYCPVCAQDQLENHQRTTWIRAHQLPGVAVCFRHGNFLVNSSLPLGKAGDLRAEIEFPEVASISVASVRDSYLDSGVWSINNPHLLLAQVSHAVLGSNFRFSDQSKVRLLYGRALHRHGLISGKAIDWSGIELFLRDCYGELLAKQLGGEFKGVGFRKWLGGMIHGTQYPRQSFRHVLLLGALFDRLPSVKEVELAMPIAGCDNVAHHQRPIFCSEKNKDRNAIRSKIRALIQEKPDLRRTDLRKLLGWANYEWALKYDTEWLDLTVKLVPKCRRRDGSRAGADWGGRDMRVALIIQKLPLGQKARLRRGRSSINLSELARITNNSQDVLRRVIKQPATKAELQKLRLGWN